jgi:hypothetical protein
MKIEICCAVEIYITGGKDNILWHVDPLLGNDCEISNYTTAVTRQRSLNSNRKCFLCGPCRDVISSTS